MGPKTKLISKIRMHPVASFFAVAFLISWTLLFLDPVVAVNGTSVFNTIHLVGSFGPSLSAIIVASLINSEPSHASAKKRWATFATVFVATLVMQMIAVFYFNYESGLYSIVASTIAAYVISCVYHPKQGVAQLMAGLKRVSPRSVWVWVALLLPFVWQVLGGLVDFGLGGNEFSLTVDGLVFLVAFYPFIFFFLGALNEEAGWRGFAVPRLQQKLSPLAAGLLIGVVWSIWHLPMHITVYDLSGLADFPFRFVYNVPLGVTFSWLYNRSNKNLFACTLLHASYNSASQLFGPVSSLISIGLMIGFTAAVAIYDKMYLKPANLPKQPATSPTSPTGTTDDATSLGGSSSHGGAA